ncbi:phenylacetate--CoA ligase PaaK [Bacillus thermotolerans]|mgnify:CR=1 FL=1|uniref:Phenylacetate-coenzyme A ligase n=1 Tax=Bacillus thermotolerans TaxID=1221996 RepID=A0A0F5HRJ2_BACTR|nr:phenylacetate--CoA ligase PaaK [Bacillus thermotolerans]KKB35941.1 Phenylacetate-coenzyme A ligase [Bacillus thermotolerans]KKB41168.1 Phenylacetate-coenzyme A ligase [Bacillus thermotolerans]KKB43030.1 Phenylacetate-coenzyme A ligase [Bacillus thermotolerans]
MYNPAFESMERSKKEELQINRLKTTVEKVYNNVEFYRNKFNELGITPQDINSLEDIQKLPFTKKQDLRDNYPFGLFAVSQEEVVRIHGSSGTSGKPTVVGYTQNDIDMWGEIIARSIVAAGGRKSDIFHNAYGYGLFTGGLGLHFGAEKLGAAVVPISGGNTDRQITLIQDFKPRGIAGTPSYVMNIAEKMVDMGLDPRETSLEYGIFGAEPWSEAMREKLEQTFNIKAVDIYGLSEVMGPGVAIECQEAQDGLHIQEDHFFVEVIDPETLQPVPEGQDGELVFTSLTKEAFPIIRYRTGDIASITRETCACGRTTVRMSRVKGRTDDMIILRGVNVFPSEIERVLLEVKGLAPNYQIHLLRKGTMDGAELHVEVDGQLYEEIAQDLNHETIMKMRKQIQHAMKNTCLVTMDVVFNVPKAIPRSEGKAIRVVDLRNSGAVGV